MNVSRVPFDGFVPSALNFNNHTILTYILDMDAAIDIKHESMTGTASVAVINGSIQPAYAVNNELDMLRGLLESNISVSRTRGWAGNTTRLFIKLLDSPVVTAGLLLVVLNY